MIEEERKRFRKFKVIHSLKSWVVCEEDGGKIEMATSSSGDQKWESLGGKITAKLRSFK